jgi:hypothetical protein
MREIVGHLLHECHTAASAGFGLRLTASTSRKPHFAHAAFLRALGAHCRKKRLERGVSVNQLAKAADRLSPSVILRLELARGPVTILALFRYASALDLPLPELLDFPFSAERPPPRRAR